MKAILIALLAVGVSTGLGAQPANELTAQHIAFCNANFPDTLILELRNELEALESYLIAHGLLQDDSGESYYAVYKRIAKENDLTFVLEAKETKFSQLASLDREVSQRCFYKPAGIRPAT